MTELVMDRTVKVGDRTYAYLYRVDADDIRWFYMPYGVAQMHLSARPELWDEREMRRRYGV